MKKLLIIVVLLSISAYSLCAQNKMIKGRVISEHIETMPGVSIMINDTIEIGKTDLNGYFEIDIPVSVRKIFFRSVGLEPTIIKLVDECDEIEVVIMLSSTHDFISLKKADRLRMKRFKKLPKLYKVAFDKGIFKTEKACYTQEFISYYNKKTKVR